MLKVAPVPAGYSEALVRRKITLLEAMTLDRRFDYLPTLVQLLNTEERADMKQHIVALLGSSKDARILPTLEFVSAPHQPRGLRLAAIEAIGDSEIRDGLPIVQKYLADPDQEIRETASFQADWLQAKPAPPWLKEKLRNRLMRSGQVQETQTAPRQGV